MTGRLTELAPGVHAWLQEPARPGVTNAGVVIDADGVTLVDSLMVPSQYEPLAETVERWGLPIRRLVLTSSHIGYVGGSARFWMAACYGRPQTSALLDQPPNVVGYRRMMPEFVDELDDDLRTRPVSHTVTDPVQLTDALAVYPVTGQQLENLVLVAPGAGVLFAGAMCSFGTTPLAFDGDPAAWADQLEQMAGWAPVVVPGQGPIGGPADVLALRDYLRACVAADGDAAAIGPGPWDGWTMRENDAVNVERAAMLARGDTSVPPTMLHQLGLA